MDLREKLSLLGIGLFDTTMPGGSYASVNVRKNIAYVAIQFPILNGQPLYKGTFGMELETEDGYKAMQLCAANVLAHIDKKIGFDKVVGLNHIDAYYRSAIGWDESPKIVDGASNLFLNILEEKGIHSRAILGVASLPRNFSVGLVSSFTIET